MTRTVAIRLAWIDGGVAGVDRGRVCQKCASCRSARSRQSAEVVRARVLIIREEGAKMPAVAIDSCNLQPCNKDDIKTIESRSVTSSSSTCSNANTAAIAETAEREGDWNS